MQTILFLCSGNYYRSRFAEALFNHLAAERGLHFRADSRGLRVRPESGNVGPISLHALEGLKIRGLPLPPERFPQQVTEPELAAAHLVVALKEAEHRAMMETHFPAWASRIRYWHVHDLDCATPAVALAELETLIRDLAAELAAANGHH